MDGVRERREGERERSFMHMVVALCLHSLFIVIIVTTSPSL